MQSRQRLGPNQHLPAVEAIYPYPGKGGEQEGWDLSHEADQAKHEGRPGQTIDQPAGGDPGHPGADQGDALTAEKETEVTVSKSTPCVGDALFLMLLRCRQDRFSLLFHGIAPASG